MNSIIRFVIALLLLPLCAAVTQATVDMVFVSSAAVSPFAPSALALAGGGVLWVVFYLFLPHPMRAYILAHELTHAVWGLIFGARVSNLDIQPTGGSVHLTKTNTLITLAPYFFPFYTMILVAIRLLLGLFMDPAPYHLLWLFLIGLSWSFHLTFTLNSLLIHQPDIAACGRLFSYVLIYLLNLTGVGLWIVCTTPATPAAYADALTARTRAAYVFTVRQASRLLPDRPAHTAVP
jgi:hypothetical protein